MTPTQTPAQAQHFAMIRRDIEDTGTALQQWWVTTHFDARDAVLWTAVEALTRAVATLAQVVEEQGQEES